MTTLTALEQAVVGRARSLFEEDFRTAAPAIAAAIRDRRVLIVGGAGSIGAATTHLALEFGPRALHVVDVSENYLAELVRDLRSGATFAAGTELRFEPIDFGSPVMARFLQQMAPYDLVLNFAAVKHVRSEKDVCSTLQMLDTNVVKQARFKRWLSRRSAGGRYFAVSTDKAANPTSYMGATKRLMEDVLFAKAADDRWPATSARFANVAFSNGSLLQSFLLRLEKRQPLAAPEATRRYFVAHREAAELCLIAAAALPPRHLAIPRLDPAAQLVELEEVASRVLAHFGYRPVVYRNEADARNDLPRLAGEGAWPLILTPLDTSGEKPFEEFVGEDEALMDVGLRSIAAIRHAHNPRFDERVIDDLEALCVNWENPLDKNELVAWLARALPTFHHVETGRGLDERV